MNPRRAPRIYLVGGGVVPRRCRTGVGRDDQRDEPLGAGGQDHLPVLNISTNGRGQGHVRERPDLLRRPPQSAQPVRADNPRALSNTERTSFSEEATAASCAASATVPVRRHLVSGAEHRRVGGEMLGKRFGTPEEVALAVVDSEVGEDLDAFLIADEFGDGVLPHAARDLDDCGDQGAVGRVGGAMPDEFAVDLEVVKRKVFEVIEGAEAGTEVIEREFAAEL